MKQFDPSVFDFDNPSFLFRLEDRLKSLLGEPLMYRPFFTRQGGFRGSERVLDYGCGGGVSTRCIAAMLTQGGKVTGIDVSQYFVELAQRRLQSFPNAEVLRGDIRKLAIEEGAYDVVSVIHVIHDIVAEERLPTVQALARALKPGGRLWILEPTRMSHGMPVAEIRELANKAGLTEVESEIGKNSFRGIFQKAVMS